MSEQESRTVTAAFVSPGTARAVRAAGQLSALLGAVLIFCGLDVGASQPYHPIPEIPELTVTPNTRSHGSPVAVVRSEHPWMLFVGIWLTAGGAAAGFLGEVIDNAQNGRNP